MKVKAKKSSLKLGDCANLAARYCESFEILERKGPIAYKIALPASLHIHDAFHVSFLKKYVPGTNHIVDWKMIQVELEGNFQVQLVYILDTKVKVLWNQAIGMVKVQWIVLGREDATWEQEEVMRAEYPHLFA